MMNSTLRRLLTFSAMMLLVLLAVAACTKGSGVGGTADNPQAVETAGAPPVPEHAPEDAEDIHHATAPKPAGDRQAQHEEVQPHPTDSATATVSPATATTTATETAPHH
jgi:hypothetical protein